MINKFRCSPCFWRIAPAKVAIKRYDGFYTGSKAGLYVADIVAQIDTVIWHYLYLPAGSKQRFRMGFGVTGIIPADNAMCPMV